MKKKSILLVGAGAMAGEVIKKTEGDPRFTFLPYCLDGEKEEKTSSLIPSTWKIHRENHRAALKAIREEVGDYIALVFTWPLVGKENVEDLCSAGVPFVMGTTGVDIDTIRNIVENSGNIALCSSNFAKQVVALFAAMKYMAKSFPDVFSGYTLKVIESHQAGKMDTSGTAREMVGYFNAMGVPFTKEQIVMVREPDKQLAMGIPAEHLAGHGWHNYRLFSSSGDMLIAFTHNINGRGVYAAGALDAVEFLARKVEAGERGKLYSMIDVLSEKK